MALLQIAEPHQNLVYTSPEVGPSHAQRCVAGIDLGTTNSLIASVRDGVADTLSDAYGQHLLPSVVNYQPDGTILVGAAAKAQAAKDPLNTIASVKRLLGRNLQDLQASGVSKFYELVCIGDSPVPRVLTRAGHVSPIEVSAEILKTLGRRAQDTLGAPLTGVVITVPAYFDDAQRQATKDAAQLAGMHVLRLLNEPTAAALAYGLDHQKGAWGDPTHLQSTGTYAIYDLGGGTFDITILRLQHGIFEVLATAGDTALGGDDIDHILVEWMLTQAGINVYGHNCTNGEERGVPHISDAIGHSSMRLLLQYACAIKEALTTAEQMPIEVRIPDTAPWVGNLERGVFENLIDPILNRTLVPCQRALRDASLTPQAITNVVLVGGATRIPRVRELVARFFHTTPLTDLDPDRVVAIGAAIQAHALAGNQSNVESLLLDVIPLSLGLETMGGLVEVIIPRNTTIPVTRAQDFTTFKDGQTAIAIHVVQGERDLVQDCRSLARFTLHGIPPRIAGAARIRVTFTVDADGLLSVSAIEQSSGITTQITVKPSYGLNDGEIVNMLKSATKHAAKDKDIRQLREAQVEADRVIEALRAALTTDGQTLLTDVEQAKINQALQILVDAAQSTDVDLIRQRQQQLEEHCSFYVERRMNAGIQSVLKEKRVEEFCLR